jgi:hypothetical protein
MHDKDDRCPGDDDLTQRVIIIRKVIGLIHDGICFYITYIHHAIPRNFQVAPSIVSFHSLKTLLNKVTASQEVHSSDFTSPTNQILKHILSEPPAWFSKSKSSHHFSSRPLLTSQIQIQSPQGLRERAEIIFLARTRA